MYLAVPNGNNIPGIDLQVDHLRSDRDTGGEISLYICIVTQSRPRCKCKRPDHPSKGYKSPKSSPPSASQHLIGYPQRAATSVFPTSPEDRLISPLHHSLYSPPTMQFSSILVQLATVTAVAVASPTASAACPPCNLACPRIVGNSIGLPQFCAIVNGKALCVPSPSCGGFGGGIGGGIACPSGFKCVADDVLGGSSQMCIPL
ncbi:hypothetical protein F5Y19DRAFT_473504 [Xylariaceae sp. FL1651]|nr:hypothetical protein F5Y19DRAFT_473504 [Xylariaceae sp. FL1651]